MTKFFAKSLALHSRSRPKSPQINFHSDERIIPDLASSRRRFLKMAAAGIASAGLPSYFAQAAAKNVTVGIIYVGPRDDFGWNQSHAVAAKALKAIPGVKVVEQENVPETIACAKSMQSMIELDGAELIFGTSFGYFDPFMIDLAKKYTNVEFRHPSTLWNPAKHPQNLGSYFGLLNQAHYVDGVAAGLSTTTNKIGFVAAKPIPLVLNNANSFLLGVRKTNPQAMIQVVFTGDWSLPVREAEATTALVDAGCDVIAANVDSPKVVVEIAEKRGVKTCGHNASQGVLAPNGFITGAEFKWETIYKGFAANLAKGEKLPNLVVGGYEADMVQNTPFGAGASGEARKAALAAIADLKVKKPIYVGPLKDNKGKLAIDRTYDNLDPYLNQIDYLLEGIAGSIT
jgi:basic membrane protein A and related proteins